MRQVDLSDKDKFAVRSTPEFFGIVEGLMLLAGGAVVLLYGFPWIERQNMTHLVTQDHVHLAGAIAAAMGLYLLLRRRGATFDRRQKTVERWWGLGGIRLLWSTRPLSAQAVRVDRRSIRYRKARAVYYPMTLVQRDSRLTLAVGYDYGRTCCVAESLASFLGVRFQNAC